MTVPGLYRPMQNSTIHRTPIKHSKRHSHRTIIPPGTQKRLYLRNSGAKTYPGTDKKLGKVTESLESTLWTPYKAINLR